MDKYAVRIEIQDGEIEEIMETLRKAQETIYDCYNSLRDLGVVAIRKAVNENADGK